MSLRIRKVNQLIKKALGEILLQDVKDPNIGFCTVTDVDVSSDLRNAWVMVSVMGEEKEKETSIEHLQKASGYINKLLRSKVELRYTPRLHFKLDNTLDHSFKIESIIKEIHVDEPEANLDDE
jgi:ribosome-binding factor A